MKLSKKENLQDDIAEAFEFVRFLLKNPRTLKKVKNGSEIRFVPALRNKALIPTHLVKKVQTFTTETIFKTWESL